MDSIDASPSKDCRRCYFSQVPALDDRFYIEAVRPYCWFAASLLFLSYIIGLWFTLRTHAAVIWNNESDEKKLPEPPVAAQAVSATHPRLQRLGSTNTSGESRHEGHGAEIRETQMYKRILGQSLKQAGISTEQSRHGSVTDTRGTNGSPQTPHLPPPKSSGGESMRSEMRLPGLTEAQNTMLVREVAEMAATAATIAARDASRVIRRPSNAGTHAGTHKHHGVKAGVVLETEEAVVAMEAATGGGHDAPNWGRGKSALILCVATILYALIAEILVNTVDVVLSNVAIDEKFLGITLFALVPNTTEFLVRTHNFNFHLLAN